MDVRGLLTPGALLSRCVLVLTLNLEGGGWVAQQGRVAAFLLGNFPNTGCGKVGEALHWLSHHLALKMLNGSTAQTVDQWQGALLLLLLLLCLVLYSCIPCL
jgi:hypothetical protein